MVDTGSQAHLMTGAHQFSPQTPSFPPRPGEYLPILDGWRGAAILLVLLFHGLLHTDTAGRTYLAVLAYFVGRMGALGVLVFFCISGYLITTKLLSESEVHGAFSIHAFYIKRIFRILPPLAVYLIVLVILSAAGVIKLAAGDWSAPLFLRNYLPGSWYTSHFWSLSVEEHFYLFWPVCILVSGWKRAMWIGLFLIAIVAVERPWELQHVMSQARALQHTEMRLDYIMMGCVVALATNFHPIVARRIRALGSSLGLTVLFLALVFSTLPRHFDTRSIQATIITLLVCGSAAANSRLSRLLLANPIMLFIGRISYSLYIWQQLFLGPQSRPFLRSPSALPIKFAAIVVVASLSYFFIERPFIQYGRTLLRKYSVAGVNERVNHPANIVSIPVIQ